LKKDCLEALRKRAISGITCVCDGWYEFQGLRNEPGGAGVVGCIQLNESNREVLWDRMRFISYRRDNLV
jgi:hypothetical protein